MSDKEMCVSFSGSSDEGDTCNIRTEVGVQKSKIRRVMEAPELRDCTQMLHNQDNTHAVACRFSVSSCDNCAIMHEPTYLVTIADLPSGWPLQVMSHSRVEQHSAVQYVDANTAHLPCGHVFSPSALALHFLVQDMRCPVCRAGSTTRMSISSVPLSIRHIYAKKVQEISKTDDELHVSLEEVLGVISQMNFQVRVRVPRRSRSLRSRDSATACVESVIRSRLLASEVDIREHLDSVQAAMRDDAPVSQSRDRGSEEDFGTSRPEADESGPIRQATMTDFRTHRSFQRILQSIVERQPPMTTIGFMLEHPLLPLEIRSVSMTALDVRASLFGEAPDGLIPLTCSVISGVEPIAYVHTSRDDATSVSNLSVRINLGLVVNMAIYVGEVLHHLDEVRLQGGQDFEVDI